MSFFRTLPLASRSSLPARSSCPAPSATTMTACDFPAAKRRSSAVSRPRGPSISNFTSGTRQKLTFGFAIDAAAAMKPESRPISFTRPMPCGVPFASTCALRVTSAASATAVSKPKLRPMKTRSLSIVFGMPTTEIFSPRCAISVAMSLAHRSEPSPPMLKRTLMFIRTSVSTMMSVGCAPRLDPRTVPPCSWIVSTLSGLSISGS